MKLNLALPLVLLLGVACKSSPPSTIHKLGGVGPIGPSGGDSVVTWGPGAATPGLAQFSTANAVPATFTIAPQVSSNVAAVGSRLNLDIGLPAGAGTEGYVAVTRNAAATTSVSLGAWTSAPTTVGQVTLGNQVPSATNYALIGSSSITYVSGPANLGEAIAGSLYGFWSVNGFQLFDAGATDFGGGTGIFGLNADTADPTAFPSTSVLLYGTHTGQTLGLASKGITIPNTLPVTWAFSVNAPASSGGTVAGQALTWTSQAGGTNTANSGTAGAGGSNSLIGGTGGTESGSNSTGGAGGNVILQPGPGGTGTSTNGAAGAINMVSAGNTVVAQFAASSGAGTSPVGFIPAATSPISVTSTPVTLSAAQYLLPYVVLTGATGTNPTIVNFPNQPGFWFVDISATSNENVDNLTFKSGTAACTTISTAPTINADIVMVHTGGSNTIVCQY